MNTKRRCVLVFALFAGLALAPPRLLAQAYPSKPLSTVVVYAAGGTADIVGRTLAAQLSKHPRADQGGCRALGRGDRRREDHDGMTLAVGTFPRCLAPHTG